MAPSTSRIKSFFSDLAYLAMATRLIHIIATLILLYCKMSYKLYPTDSLAKLAKPITDLDSRTNPNKIPSCPLFFFIIDYQFSVPCPPCFHWQEPVVVFNQKNMAPIWMCPCTKPLPLFMGTCFRNKSPLMLLLIIVAYKLARSDVFKAEPQVLVLNTVPMTGAITVAVYVMLVSFKAQNQFTLPECDDPS